MRYLYEADSAVEATVADILGLQKRLIALGAAIPKRLVSSVAVNELPRPLSVPATGDTVAAHLCRPPGPPRESMLFTHGSNVVDHKGGSRDRTTRPYRHMCAICWTHRWRSATGGLQEDELVGGRRIDKEFGCHCLEDRDSDEFLR